MSCFSLFGLLETSVELRFGTIKSHICELDCLTLITDYFEIWRIELDPLNTERTVWLWSRLSYRHTWTSGRAWSSHRMVGVQVSFCCRLSSCQSLTWISIRLISLAQYGTQNCLGDKSGISWTTVSACWTLQLELMQVFFPHLARLISLVFLLTRRETPCRSCLGSHCIDTSQGSTCQSSFRMKVRWRSHRASKTHVEFWSEFSKSWLPLQSYNCSCSVSFERLIPSLLTQVDRFYQ